MILPMGRSGRNDGLAAQDDEVIVAGFPAGAWVLNMSAIRRPEVFWGCGSCGRRKIRGSISAGRGGAAPGTKFGGGFGYNAV